MIIRRVCILTVAVVMHLVFSLAAAQSTPDTAPDLRIDEEVSGNMISENWWRITTTQFGALTVSTESDKTLIIELKLFDRNMIEIAGSELGDGIYQSTSHMFLSSGIYYVKAVPKYNSSGSFIISSRFIPSVYVNENNFEDHGQPVSITSEKIYTGHLGYYDSGVIDKEDNFIYDISEKSNIYFKAVGEPTIDIDMLLVETCGCGTSYLNSEGTHEWHFSYLGGLKIIITRHSGGYGAYAFIITKSRYTPPVIFTTSLKRANVELEYEQTIAAADLDFDDEITFELLDGPEWLNIDSEGVLRGRPGIDDIGAEIPVKIRAVDLHSLEDSLSTAIDVIFKVVPPADLVAADVPNDHGYRLELKWKLSAVDRYISHYNIYRSQRNLFADPLALESFDNVEDLMEAEKRHAIHIGTVEAGVNTFLDSFITQNDVIYYYWIAAVTNSEESEKVAARYVTDVTHVDETPSAFRAYPPYPNPFNPSTVIRYEVPYDCHVSMVVYDILGRKVAVLRDGRVSAGVHEEVWNGRDDNGIVLGSGLYLYKIIAGGYTAHGKVMFLR